MLYILFVSFRKWKKQFCNQTYSFGSGWEIFDEFLNAQETRRYYLLENNGRIIGGNEESTLHLIVKDTNGEYRTSNDTDEYLEKVIILPKLPDVKFHYFYALNSKLSYLNKSFVLMFMSGIVCFFLLWYIIIVITRKISGESGKLVRNLEHLGNSVYKEDKVDISTEDSREIVELKKIINTIGEKYKEKNWTYVKFGFLRTGDQFLYQYSGYWNQ